VVWQCDNRIVFRSPASQWTPVQVNSWYYNLYVQSAIQQAQTIPKSAFIVAAEEALGRTIKSLRKSSYGLKRFFSEKAALVKKTYFKVVQHSMH